MIVNSNWLKEYTDVPFSAQELEKKLTDLGLEATIKQHPAELLENVVVAYVEDRQQHPDADRLSVCKVTDGTQQYNVVCGAPNVAAGQKVFLAKIGAVLPGDFKIKKAKVRGVVSEGMICAEDELGLSDDHEGIMVLPESTELGISIGDFIRECGAVIDIDLTPNRPDGTSHIGVARDLTLLTGAELKKPEIKFTESDDAVENYISVEIENKIGCPRYAARMVRGVKTGPSPVWLKTYLESVGIRSVNNVVDAANFVLLETGHPLHTFDYRMIEGKKIIVRSAKKDEVVTTLDSIERKLSDDILLICDGVKPVAVAGIMGLENSEIKDDTTDVLIESAYFDPATVRKGSKYLALQTDASYRFERGADHEGVIYALNRVADLIVEVAGGTVCKGIVDNYARKIEMSEITVRFKRINSLISVDFEADWVVSLFEKLGAEIVKKTDDAVIVKSPTWRPDLEREIDYVEEVVRVYGMENVPPAKRFTVSSNPGGNDAYDSIENVRSLMCGYGYFEIYNNSLVSEKYAGFMKTGEAAVSVLNPLNQEMAFMRTILMPGLVQTAERNIKRQNKSLRLFELGNVQQKSSVSETGAIETMKLGVLVTGNLESKQWNYEIRQSSLFALKGLASELSMRIGAGVLTFEKNEIDFCKNSVAVKSGNEIIGYTGEIKPVLLDKEWDIEQPVYVLEINIEKLLEKADKKIRYQALPVYPAIERDISIVIPETVKTGDVEALINANGSKLLKKVNFYDLYKGKNIAKGKKSFTFNLVFQNPERTLKDKEVDKIMDKIIKKLSAELNAELR